MIIAFSGPSGIGKGFIKEGLLRLHPHMKELEWLTTRSLRSNGKEGNRTHVSAEQFTFLVQSGEVVLAQNHFGHQYGLRKGDLSPSQETRLTELHPCTVAEALRINPEIILVGLVTFDISLLRRRLTIIRKTESPAEIEKRLTQADDEIKAILGQRELFASVVEVSEAKEPFLMDEILSVLPNFMKGA